jgi:hypothetical protein
MCITLRIRRCKVVALVQPEELKKVKRLHRPARSSAVARAGEGSNFIASAQRQANSLAGLWEAFDGAAEHYDYRLTDSRDTSTSLVAKKPHKLGVGTVDSKPL